jgi:hypothetical protein
MLEIELTSISEGAHTVCFGLSSDELSNFEIQMWIEKFGPRAVDWLERLSLGWVSFMGGDLWIQNSPDVDRNNFFGEANDSLVGIAVNEQPNVIKILDSLGIHTDAEWEVTSVTIPKTLNHPHGMSSRIPSNRFKYREGVYRAEFLRNEYTTSGTANTLDLLRGEELRGEAAYVVLTNSSTSEVRLYKINIDMTSSKF